MLLPVVSIIQTKTRNAARRPLPAVWGRLQPGTKTVDFILGFVVCPRDRKVRSCFHRVYNRV